ncbi:beta-ketoacyl synthase N-terminal-like domain-containing protein [Paenibacillus polymyxa]|uniref:beta-ketoacyl synthase N-terminal-like domain-containing protein n=1 Tax=Paenibacillus polymyxa TaxID=1406 RepID=UPI0004DEE717|nr:beta-ketoacyl synthase N-terminal-like domain-containing protein [Paenibacillus polymyxa]RPE06775.1 hypothetical protein EG487_08340 [Paenibacillus polymyxa]
MNDHASLSEKLTRDLISVISKISSISEQDISLQDDIEKYGFNSITLMELANDLNKKMGISLTPAAFFELKELTPYSLVQHLCSKYAQELTRYYNTSSSSVSSTGESTLNSLVGRTHIMAKAVNPFRFHDQVNDSIQPQPLDTFKQDPLEEPIQESRSSLSHAEDDYTPIAVIGIGGMMPQSDSIEDFWTHLCDSHDLITEIPSNRWDWREYHGDAMRERNKTLCKWGGFLKDVDTFEPSFFHMSPKEAEIMDPQQRKFLEIAWKTIEDAGYKPSALAGSLTGVFIGVTNNEYTDLIAESKLPVDSHSIVTNAHFLIANRTSYFFDFHGPSEAVDTACSSSGVALHRAVSSLHTGECSTALVGGVNVLASPRNMIAFDVAGMLSREGRCKTFDQNADGFVRGEGIGALLLKPLPQAIADHDSIYAVIKGSAVNHNGRSKSLTAPNPASQAEVIKSALSQSGAKASTITYMEVHGTGTALGDSVEIEGMRRAFQEMADVSDLASTSAPFCGLGSVKTNIGHLEAASGMASLLKVILALKYKQLPPSLHCNTLNPHMQLDKSPFYVVREKTEWKRIIDSHNNKEIPRRAGINIFGAGGVNAHIVLEEYEQHTEAEPTDELEQVALLFSARTQESLREIVKETADFVERHTHLNLKDVAYTLQTGRDEMPERVVLVVSSLEEFISKARIYLNNSKEVKKVGIYQTDQKIVRDGICDLMNDDAVSEIYLDMLLQHHQWAPLSKLWVNGVSVVWEHIYKDEPRRRVHLPTYVFAKQRYWLSRYKESSGLARPSTLMPELLTQSISGVERELSNPQEILTLYFKNKTASILGMHVEGLQADRNWQEFGFDSITATKLKFEIEHELGLTLPMEVLGESNCINELSARVVSDLNLEEFLQAIEGKGQYTNLDSLQSEELDALYEVLSKRYTDLTRT